jgi:hypothetical protein
MTVKDVLITLGWGAAPYVCSVKTAQFDESKVLHNDRMVYDCPVGCRFKVSNRIQVRYVHTPSVRSRAFIAILVNIHAKQEHISTMDLLE